MTQLLAIGLAVVTALTPLTGTETPAEVIRATNRAKAAVEAEIEPEEAPAMHLYGTCTITHYCNCAECCGQWAGGATASGTTPTAGRTVAADLPFGTRLMINGQEYVVEDRGVSGMWVDIYVDSHDEALQKGMYQADVYLITGGGEEDG